MVVNKTAKLVVVRSECHFLPLNTSSRARGHETPRKIYAAAKIGSLVWTAAWDKQIFTWQQDVAPSPSSPFLTAPSQPLEFYRTNVNSHGGAVRDIIPVWQTRLNGWQVWTGSDDGSIYVQFVPANYADTLGKEAPPAAGTFFSQ